MSGITFEFRLCESEGRRVDSSHSAGFVRVRFLQKEGFSTFVIHCYAVFSLSSPSVKSAFPKNSLEKLWCGAIALFGKGWSSLQYWQRLSFCTVNSGNNQPFLLKPSAYVGSICFKSLVLNRPCNQNDRLLTASLVLSCMRVMPESPFWKDGYALMPGYLWVWASESAQRRGKHSSLVFNTNKCWRRGHLILCTTVFKLESPCLLSAAQPNLLSQHHQHYIVNKKFKAKVRYSLGSNCSVKGKKNTS